MPPQRTAAVDSSTGRGAPYALALLSEYTHTLDCLPVDISRNFADLRELDAVLSSSMTSLTDKVRRLTAMIEEGPATQSDRLYLLSDIAEEAKRLKLGGEDKIRVACQAADNLAAHMLHLRTLAEQLPDFDAQRLVRRTTFPHVTKKRFLPPDMANGRRRPRAGMGTIMDVTGEPGSVKRPVKKVVKDDDYDAGPSRSPKKVADAKARAKGIKSNRAASPTDSLVSVTSQFPLPPLPMSAARSGGNRSGNPARRIARSSVRDASVQPAERPSGSRPAFPLASTHPSLRPDGPMRSPLSQATGFVSSPAPPVPVDDTADGGETDEDKKIYCYCKSVSFGDMVGCDNADCPWQWFHLGCIGMEKPPEGDWYCTECRAKVAPKRTNRAPKKRGGGGRAR
ncbi:hypothetical protein BD626DRAFT_501767 [Schizophyllum amplum]|uniref:Chromatin modification-related protein n=1 Tax=Schizophyllum amplum TaxID=97359 RepID=A0A550CA28_9AGAR|nr:hypothetical protein BD626DRAFT_501767 [Auriculariopsis ampla]